MPKTEEILVPDLGDFDKVEVTEVLVEVDQNITSNENIITVETDKASIDVPSDKTGKIHSVKVKVGDYIMLEMFVEEAESVGGVYNNLFMKNYVTAILKKQWGENISKFEGMTLPGGVTLNGRQLIDDAKEEIEREIEKLRNEYDNPPNFFVG